MYYCNVLNINNTKAKNIEYKDTPPIIPTRGAAFL